MLTFEAASLRVTEDLDQAERLANEALRANARLMQSMMNLRIDTDLRPYEGQIAVVRVQEATAALVEAQNALAKAHKTLRADFIRISSHADDYEPCPSRKPPSGIREVA
jgi:hypothetical protein